MDRCPHCRLPLESTAKPIPRSKFVTSYRRRCWREEELVSDEIVHFDTFHARQAMTTLHEHGITIERAKVLIYWWNRSTPPGEMRYEYELILPQG